MQTSQLSDASSRKLAEEDNELLFAKDERELKGHLLQSHNDDFQLLCDDLCLAPSHHTHTLCRSFFQEFSLDPLMCSRQSMLDVVKAWQVSSMFIDVLLKFGDQPQIFQESSGFRRSYQDTDGSFGQNTFISKTLRRRHSLANDHT